MPVSDVSYIVKEKVGNFIVLCVYLSASKLGKDEYGQHGMCD